MGRLGDECLVMNEGLYLFISMMYGSDMSR